MAPLATEPGLLEDEDDQGGGCEVAAHGEAEQASQAEQRLAVGAHLALGVLEGLVLVGTDVHTTTAPARPWARRRPPRWRVPA
eukprot:scaffold133422_cov81-Phaeocystis_antarctica.AAC.2